MSYQAIETPPKYATMPGGPAATQQAADYAPMVDDFNYGVVVSQADVSIRMAFVRRVYSILTTQLALTAVISALMMYSGDGFKHWIAGNTWMLWISSFGSLGALLALFAYRRSTPLNFYLLWTFTALEAFSIGTVCAFQDSRTVLQAVFLTLGIFVFLTMYTMQTDFSSWGPYLGTFFWALFMVSLMQVFFPFVGPSQAGMGFMFAALFSAYIVYDTNAIMKTHSPEEYIAASVALYLDILNLFLQVLRLLQDSNRN